MIYYGIILSVWSYYEEIHYVGIKFIMGQLIAWPTNNLIGRFSFSLDRKDIILGLTRMRQALSKLN